MNDREKRKCFLDPCHSKNVNVSNLQLSRMKLKMKLELRALKKITEEVVHEGDGYVVVVPANVYENPLDTIPIQPHEGINGCYGCYVTDEQLKTFFGENIPQKATPPPTKDNATYVEKKKPVELPTPKPTKPKPKPSVAVSSPETEHVPISCPDDDIELQNAIWNITPDMSLGNPTVPTDQISFDDFLMDHTGDDTGILFDLS